MYINSLRFPKFLFLNKQGCCKQVTLSAIGEVAAKFQSYIGVYGRNGNHHGAPIYGKIGGGGKIMRKSDGRWIVRRGIGDRVDFRSVDTAPCPARINHWKHKPRHGRLSGRITVKCSQNWNKIKCDISSTSLAQQKFVIYKCHNTNSTEVACKGPGPGPGPGSGPTYSGVSCLQCLWCYPQPGSWLAPAAIAL